MLDVSNGGGGSDAILNVRSVAKSFGGVQAVKEVSLDVERGSIFSIIGPNG
ncbi:MAG: ABC transporter ATP-binding protein, partial [Alphaproteobacteria bacterium]|nr:ABC transporter ATP-binding protein [Alphaproteobacteria bacterium]